MSKGKCACGAVKFELKREPMFVHCCHCSDCQRLSGAAYAINAMIEMSEISYSGELSKHDVATPSGAGQRVCRCAECGTAVWSHYLRRGEGVAYVKVGTLENPEECPPDVQIFTSSKQPWQPLSDDIPAFEEYYDMKSVWPADNFERFLAAI